MAMKIEAAASTTRQLADTIARVNALLAIGAPVNKLGVLIFPYDYERTLRLAAAELNTAAGIIARTPWPTESDYEKVGYTR